MTRAFEKLGTFHKVQGDTAYGWALVSSIDGEPYFDTGDGTHSDHIPEDTLPTVAAEFMKLYGAGHDMHEGERLADVLFAYPMTVDIMKGIDVSSNKTGLVIGWQPYDKDILEKIADGERIGFSIGGLVTSWDIVDADGNVIETVDVTGKSAKNPLGIRIGKSAGYDGKGKMKRRVFRSWKLHEVSLVDRPMQEGALVGVVKRADGKTAYKKVRVIARAFSKGAMLTSVVDGHQHVVDPSHCDEHGVGRTSWEKSDGEEYGHDHAFVRQPDGSYQIAANEGHAHDVSTPKLADGAPAGTTVAARAVGAPEKNAHAENWTPPIAAGSVANKSDTTEKTMPTEQEFEALKKKAARLEKMAELTETHRAYAKRLADDNLDVFLSKSLGDREAEVKAAIAYTASDGTLFFVGDDQRYVSMAKRADQAEKDSVVEKSLRQKAEFAKAAGEDMANYPEDADVHAAVIEAIETGIKDPEMKKKARTLIKAGDAAIAKASNLSGHNRTTTTTKVAGAGDELQKAEADLKTAVDAFAKAHNMTSFEAAFAEATGSDPATREAFAKVRELRSQLD